ncbi:MAG: phosphatase PAP2 family protein [Deltaproteobacteria bacterium]
MPYSLKRISMLLSCASAVVLLSLLIDPLAASIPRSSVLTAGARIGSLIGNGAFLIAACAALYVAGRALKSKALMQAGKGAFLSVIASGVIVNIAKAVFERPRSGHALNSTIELLTNPVLFDLSGRFNSFPSGHTTVSFAFAFAASQAYPALRMPLFLIAAFVGASRVYLGSHFPSDVAAGAILGAVVGWLSCNGFKDKKNEWKIALFFLLIVFVAFFKLNGYLVFDIDEAVFSEAAREMVSTGDYLTPTYNLEPRYDKPILFYWFSAVALKLFGVNEFALRFTSAGFGALLVIMTFFFVRRIRGTLAAYLSSAALLLNVLFFMYTHSAVTDATLAFFISASVYSFFMAINGQRPKFFLLFWTASALALLTKGAIGLVFPLSIALIFLAIKKDWESAKRLFNPLYIGAFLLVSVPWFALEFRANGMEFFNAFVLKHHIQRYTGVISSHGGPFYYYIGVLIVGFFPWVAFLPCSIYRAFKERKGDALLPLCCVWFLFVLIFFSIARTKLPNYIFPLIPPASIMAGIYAAGLWEKRADKQGLYALAGISVILALLSFILPQIKGINNAYVPAHNLYYLGAIFLAASILSIAAFSRPAPALYGLCAATAALLVFLRLNVLPPANIMLQKTLYDYSRYAKRLDKDTALATYELNRPSIAFYSEKKIYKIEKRNACDIKELKKLGDFIVITEPKKYAVTDELKGLRVLDERNGYMLLSSSEKMPAFR